MKKITALFFAILAVAMSLTSCHSHSEPQSIARRTVVVYMEARNDLRYNAVADLQEMLRATTPSDCRLLVYYSGYDASPQLLELRNGKQYILKTYATDASAIDPSQMAQVLADARALAPARENGLIMWSHSTGWTQSLSKTTTKGFGYEYNSQQMGVTQLASALRGLNLDFLAFDSCYMGCVEVAYELRQCARYLVASVCEVPTNGMDYAATLPAFFRADLLSGLCEAIDLTVDSYAANPSELCPSTMSLIDLSQINALAATVKANQKPLPSDYVPQLYSRDRPYRYLFFDLGQYLEAIGADSSALHAAVIHSRHTANIWGAIPLQHVSGLSIYLPELNAPAYDYTSYGYNTLAWYNYTQN